METDRERLSALEAKVDHLAEADNRFREHIDRLYGRLDRINYTLIGLLAAVVANVAVVWLRP